MLEVVEEHRGGLVRREQFGRVRRLVGILHVEGLRQRLVEVVRTAEDVEAELTVLHSPELDSHPLGRAARLEVLVLVRNAVLILGLVLPLEAVREVVQDIVVVLSPGIFVMNMVPVGR